MSWPEFRRLSWYTRYAMMDELCDMLASSKPADDGHGGERENFDEEDSGGGGAFRPKQLRK